MMARKKKTWTSLRAEIAQLASQLQIPQKNFRPLGLREWETVEKQVYKTFCKHQYYRYYWLWEDFSQEAVAYQMPNNPETYLPKLIDSQQEIFFIFAESGKNKFWFYEGKINPVLPLIGELSHYDEFYFISKKYEWLIAINHHDALIATGSKTTALEELYQAVKLNTVGH